MATELSSAATSAAAAPLSFAARVRALRDVHEALWRATPAEPPSPGPPFSAEQQRENARGAERLIDEVSEAVLRFPDDDRDRAAWRAALEARVRLFGTRHLGWPQSYQNLLFADDYYAATVAFVREARAFDAGVRAEDVGQALRNVWIGNSLQMLLDLPVRLTPSLFGYSMLYPWTDNLLDDPGVTPAAKAAFGARFGRRLGGEPVEPCSPHERQVFELVARVESEHDRAERSEVYESLLAIHRAQVGSLRQQVRTGVPSTADLVAISVEKGGTSVLADAFLVAPGLAEDEAVFAFGYGVFLQLLDDLQDAEVDRDAGHATVFSTAIARGPLDGLVCRLYGFTDRVVDGARRFAGEAYAARRDLIRRNCRLLLVSAVAESASLFTPAFVRALEERWPFDFASMRRLRRDARQRYERTLATLQRHGSVRSLLELLG